MELWFATLGKPLPKPLGPADLHLSGQQVSEVEEGPAAVGDGVLIFGGHLCEGAAVTLCWDEYGVVAEALGAAGFGRDLAFHYTPSHDLTPVGPQSKGDGDETGTPVGHPDQVGEQLGHIVGVAGRLPRITRRTHARGTSEGIHFQPGVVRNRRDTCSAAERLRLESCVGLQGLAGLVYVGDARRTGFQLDTRAHENRSDFGNLMGVGTR